MSERILTKAEVARVHYDALCSALGQWGPTGILLAVASYERAVKLVREHSHLSPAPYRHCKCDSCKFLREYDGEPKTGDAADLEALDQAEKAFKLAADAFYRLSGRMRDGETGR